MPLYGLNLFLPKIIEDMCCTNCTLELLTIPPYVASYVTIVIFSWNSGRLNERSNHLMILLLIEIIGFLYLFLSDKYLYIDVIVVGIGVPVLNALTLSWITNNVVGRTKRAIAVALGVTVTDIAGITTGQIYDQSDQVFHNKKHWSILGILCFTFILVLSLKLLLRYENRGRKYRIRSQLQTDEEPILLDMVNLVYIVLFFQSEVFFFLFSILTSFM